MERNPGGAGAWDPSRPDTGTAVFVIRAWLEGEPRQLRARLSGSFDVASQAPSLAATADSVENVLAQLRTWLETFVA